MPQVSNQPVFHPTQANTRIELLIHDYHVLTMSYFPFGDLPSIQTRKALLLIDFQNDFVRPSGALHVPNVSDILETLPALAAAFRRVGDVVWVRSQYENAQPVTDWNFGDRVILSMEPRQRSTVSSNVIEASSDFDSPESVDAEAFLSARSATCCAAQSTGFQFPAPILAAIDIQQDTLLDKTGYSALESEGLVSSFRQKFVTELYLCGSLSNVSVYATALDAVRNGFAVTLLEDCLGYRDFGRHREAMRRMADILGATGSTAQELTQELDWHETEAVAKGSALQPKRPAASSGIENIIDALGVKGEDSVAEDTPDKDTLSLLELVSQSRAQRTEAAAARESVEGKQQVRARVRRPKRREQMPKSGTGLGDDVSDPSHLSETTFGEGDSRLLPKIDLSADAFERIRAEVSWQKMYHLSGQVPRLVAVQGNMQPNGAIPIYRHPADESPPLSPFTPAVDEARIVVERILGHPFNHVLIQLYRDGQDSISEHSDKTLDIVRGSFICNVSLGAQRAMVLRTKTSANESKEGADSGRITQRFPLPHHSLFVLGEKTNMRWLHGIRPDKRPESTKSSVEQAFGGERISLTFRQIGTFINPGTNTIWGQGAIGKTPGEARPVIHGDPTETERLIRSFGQENRASEFDWDAVYGGGFDVVNFVTTSPARVALSGDRIADLRVLLGFAENGLRYEISDIQTEVTTRPLYVDPQGTTVAGDLAILTHLAQRPADATRPGVDTLQGGEHMPWIEELLKHWREYRHNGISTELDIGLDHCDRVLEGHHYLGGAALSVDDCALWPVLLEIVQTQGAVNAQFANLNQYFRRVEKRGVVKIVLEELP